MSAAGRSKYEAFIHEVLKDFDSRVQAIQTSAEENTKAYEQYCAELKGQLEKSSAVTEELRGRLAAAEDELQTAKRQFKEDRMATDSVLSFYSSMTCLSVERREKPSKDVCYHCRIEDGLLSGHSFTLSIDKSVWEYTYTPVSVSANIDPSNKFATPLCFPDYMLGRFLTNLLNTNYSTPYQN